MVKKIDLSVFDIVGNSWCVAPSDGNEVYSRLINAMDFNIKVVLSFRGVEHSGPTFLNIVIGQLYSRFKKEEIEKLLEIKDMNNEDLNSLKMVISNAKKYFKKRGYKEKEKLREKDLGIN